MARRTREQERALLAYGCVDKLNTGVFKHYKVHVHSFGATVLRNGLAAALAFLERELPPEPKKAGATAEGTPGEAAERFLDHLAMAKAPGLEDVRRGRDLPKAVRALDLERYMLATRELVHLAVWFRRAVQAKESRTASGEGEANRG